MTGLSIMVLIVDGNEINLEILKEFLASEGFLFESTKSVSQCYDMLKQSPDMYDIVILDRMMPDGDGVSILKDMRSLLGLQDLPVIIQSGLAMEEKIQEGLDAGANAYLTKPFSKQALFDAINKVLA